MHRQLTTASLGVILLAHALHAEERTPAPARLLDGTGGSPISSALLSADDDASAMHQHIVTLADPFFEGRSPGSQGGARAASYVEFHLARLGLDPLFDGSFQQEFAVEGQRQLSRASASIVIDEGEPIELGLGESFTVVGFSGSGDLEAPLTFAGYSVGRGPDRYRSYGGDDDLSGRIAVIFRFEPMNSRGVSRWAGEADGGGWSRRATLLTKAEEAIDRGAAGVVFVNPPGASDPRAGDLPGFPETASRRSGVSVPVVFVDAELMDRTLQAADPEGRSLSQWRAEADRDGRHRAIDLDGDVRIRLAVEAESVQLPTSNVGAVLQGRGTLADEFIVIGAHYDHLGFGELGGTRENSAGLLHPGADDNASGAAGLLRAAERLAFEMGQSDDADVRSVMFLAFGAEEMGLLGSDHFMHSCPVPHERMVAMLNLDMIGRLGSQGLTIYGTATAQDFMDLLEPHLDASSLEVSTTGSGLGRSDHTWFHEAGMPVLHFFSGIHDDYHTPRDVTSLINYEGAGEAVRLVTGIAWDLATMGEAPVFAWTGLGPWAPVRMGIGYVDAPSGGGVRITAVDAGTPAAAASLLRDDVILRWGGDRLADGDAMLERLADHRPGDEVELLIRRGDEEFARTITLRSRFE